MQTSPNNYSGGEGYWQMKEMFFLQRSNALMWILLQVSHKKSVGGKHCIVEMFVRYIAIVRFFFKLALGAFSKRCQIYLKLFLN